MTSNMMSDPPCSPLTHTHTQHMHTPPPTSTAQALHSAECARITPAHPAMARRSPTSLAAAREASR